MKVAYVIFMILTIETVYCTYREGPQCSHKSPIRCLKRNKGNNLHTENDMYQNMFGA
jgi:hypothetical protein